jgi:uncharacterized membrane protein YedE/YeeE
MPSLVETGDWLFGVRIAAVLVGVGFASATFLVNRKLNQWRLGFMILLACSFGLVLRFGSLGFTTAFQHIFELRFIGAMHLFLMITLATAMISVIYHTSGDKFSPLFFPDDLSISYYFQKRPVTLAGAVGAFIFGFGMHVLSLCSASALVSVGEGIIKSLIIFVFFVAGATLAIQDRFYNWWSAWPSSEPVGIEWHVAIAIPAALFLFFCIWEVVRYKRAPPGPSFSLKDAQQMMLAGVDDGLDARRQPGYGLKLLPLYCGDLVLAIAVAAWFVCVGQPIDVVGGLARLGSGIVGACGADPASWAFWRASWGDGNLMHDPGFLSDMSLVLAGMIGAALMGKFGAVQEYGVVPFLKAGLGGLCLGVGGIVAGGCNIGGMLSAITIGAPSGFVWLAAGLLGVGAGIGCEKLYERIWRHQNYAPILMEE